MMRRRGVFRCIGWLLLQAFILLSAQDVMPSTVDGEQTAAFRSAVSMTLSPQLLINNKAISLTFRALASDPPLVPETQFSTTNDVSPDQDIVPKRETSAARWWRVLPSPFHVLPVLKKIVVVAMAVVLAVMGGFQVPVSVGSAGGDTDGVPTAADTRQTVSAPSAASSVERTRQADESGVRTGETFLKSRNRDIVFEHDAFYAQGIDLDKTPWTVVAYFDADGNRRNGAIAGHEQIQTPGHWLAQGYYDVTGMVLTKSVSLPAVGADEVRILHMGGSLYYTSVRVNGHEAVTTEGDSTHEGYFMPFEYDITDLLVPGSNQLEVTVMNPNEQGSHGVAGDTGFAQWPENKRKYTGVLDFHDTRPLNMRQQEFNPGGLWLPSRIFTAKKIARITQAPLVAATLLPKPYLSEPDYVRRDVRITGSVTAGNASAKPVSLRLRMQLQPDNFVGTVSDTAVFEQGVVLAPGEHNLQISGLLSQAKLWWPWHLGEPNLYRATVTLIAPDGTELAERSTRMGVRELTGDLRGEWQLNGRTIRPLGDTIIPSMLPGMYTRRDATVDLQRIVEANIQLIRVHAHVPHPYFLEAADQLGVMVYFEFPQHLLYQWNPERGRELLRQTVSFTRIAAAHPSIMIANMHNENGAWQGTVGGLPRLPSGAWWCLSKPSLELNQQAADFMQTWLKETLALPSAPFFSMADASSLYHPYYNQNFYYYRFQPTPETDGEFPALDPFSPEFGWQELAGGVGAVPSNIYAHRAGGGGFNRFGPDEYGVHSLSPGDLKSLISVYVQQHNPAADSEYIAGETDRLVRELPWGYLHDWRQLPPESMRSDAQKTLVELVDLFGEHGFPALLVDELIKTDRPVERIGFDEVIESSQRLQAQLTQYMAEIYRRAGVGSTRFLFASSYNHADYFHCASLSVLETDRTPKLAYEALKRAYQPVLGSTQILSPYIMPGESWISGLWINNDTYRTMPDVLLRITLRDAAGKELRQTQVSASLRPFSIENLSSRIDSSQWRVDQTFSPGDYTVEITVEDNAGILISMNRYDLRLIGNDLSEGIRPEVLRKMLPVIKKYYTGLQDKFSHELGLAVHEGDSWEVLLDRLTTVRIEQWPQWKKKLEANPETLLAYTEFLPKLSDLFTARISRDQAREQLANFQGRAEELKTKMTATDFMNRFESLQFRKNRADEAYERQLLETKRNFNLDDHDLRMVLGKKGGGVPLPLLFGSEITTRDWFESFLRELKDIPGTEAAVHLLTELYNTRPGHWFHREARVFQVLRRTIHAADSERPVRESRVAPVPFSPIFPGLLVEFSI